MNVLLLKWEKLSYLRRSTAWSMLVIFSLSLTASISSAAVDRTEHWDHSLGEGTKPETESGDTHNRVNSSFRWLPCLPHTIFGVDPVTVSQDVVDNLRFVARHHLISRTVSTGQQTWKQESGCFIHSRLKEQCTFKITKEKTKHKTEGKRKSVALAKRKTAAVSWRGWQ